MILLMKFCKCDSDTGPVDLEYVSLCTRIAMRARRARPHRVAPESSANMAINKVEIVKYKLEERDGWHGGCQTICLNRHIRSLPVSVLGIRLNIIVIVPRLG